MIKSWLTIHSSILIATVVSAAFHFASVYSYFIFQPAASSLALKLEKRIHIQVAAPIEKTPPVLQQASAQIAAVHPDLVNEIKPIAKPVNEPDNRKKIEAATKPQKTVISKNIVKKKKPKKPQKTIQPAEKKLETPQIKPEEIAKVTEISPAPVQQPATLPVIVVEDTAAELEISESYIASVLERIEQNKFYPRKARRRNIQGSVLVLMAINETGNIASLDISKGHKILRQAAKKAIDQTSPFAKPPVNLIAPKTISFSINYRFSNQ